jgi:hypothetical protein
MDFWSEYEEHRLMKLRRQGMSAREVAAVLGKSRNAVIGKLDRMKLIRRRTDRPTQAQRAAGCVPPRQPSPPRKFSWQQ